MNTLIFLGKASVLTSGTTVCALVGFSDALVAFVADCLDPDDLRTVIGRCYYTIDKQANGFGFDLGGDCSAIEH